MNRLIRMILYITAGCVGIGCAALILSFALGGGRQNWEDDVFWRAKDKARNIAVSAQEQVENLKNVESSDASITLDEETAYTAEVFEGSDDTVGLLAVDSSSIDSLSIDLRHAYLSIEKSADSRIQVSYLPASDSADEIIASCDAGVITIADTRQGNKSRKDVAVYLEIPDNFQFEAADIQISAGEVDADCGFRAYNLNVTADAGMISLENLEADIFSASVGAGEIDITDSVFKSVDLDCGVGTVDMEADITEYGKIDCGMGEVNLALAKGVDSVNYMLKCGVGNIDIGDNSYSGLAKEKRIENGASTEFELNCGMGAISVDNY